MELPSDNRSDLQPCPVCGERMEYAWRGVQTDPRLDALANFFQFCKNPRCQNTAIYDTRNWRQFRIVDPNFRVFVERYNIG